MSALTVPALQSLAQRHGLVVLDSDRVQFGAVVPPSAEALREIAFSIGTHPTIVQIDSGTIPESIPSAPAPPAPEGPHGPGLTDRLWPVGSAVDLADALLNEAIDRGASDVHIEPDADALRVRFRFDGTLHTVGRLPPRLAPSLAARLKVVAGLDVAEKRRPQDGRLHLRHGDRDVDLRVSSLPTAHGEKLVLRVLDRAAAAPDLDGLGLDPASLTTLRRALRSPHGMVLATGPTGSGKTTTLYAALQSLDCDRLNVITAEDPIEYQLAGINQVHVRPDIGFGFPEALRSFLRQDPDVIMVGEIRDRETADVAVRAALTGHLVLSTLHTNDAISAVTRLTDMGVEPFLIAAALRLSLAQRLLRRLCASCKRPERSGAAFAAELGIDGDEDVFGPVGCPLCGGTGYRGRLAVVEVVAVTEPLQALAARRAPVHELRAEAMRTGWRPLRDAALDVVRRGETSLEEVLRATAL